MSGYVKWEEVKQLINDFKKRELYNDHTSMYYSMDETIKNKISELEKSAIEKVSNNNFSITFNVNEISDPVKVREFADELIDQINSKLGEI